MSAFALAVLAGLLAAAATMGLWHVANVASLGADVAPMVRQAYADGELRDQVVRIEDVANGEQQFNDCLILDMALDRRGPRALLAVSPSYGYSHLGSHRVGQGPCDELVRMTSSFAGRPQTYYHNYIHGQVPLTRLLAPLSLGGIRNLYKTILSGLVGVGFALSLAGLAMGKDTTVWAIVFAVMARWFGLEDFGQSLGHGPSDIILIGFALFLAFGSFLGGLSTRAIVAGAALFGALTAVFELLTGAIPLGLALVLGGTLFASPTRPTLPAVAFLGGLLGCFAIKAGLVLHAFGSSAALPIIQRLGERVAGHPAGEVPVDSSLSSLFAAMAQSTEAMAAGMRSLALFMLILSIVAGGWGLSCLLTTPLRRQAQWLSGSNLVIVGWLLLFRQHSVLHAWFMDRILAWTIASGMALFVLALSNRRLPLLQQR